jgi:Flp pilus assembly pilin Flp
VKRGNTLETTTRTIEALDSEGFGVLARSVTTRLVEISRSGCLLESQHRVEEGTVGELRLCVGDEQLRDDIRVTRCVLMEGSGWRYLVGAEFVQTRSPDERSIRRAVTGILRGLNEGEKGLHTRVFSRNGSRAEAVVATPSVNAVSIGEGAMKDLLTRFVRQEEGQDLIEYGLLAGLITTALVTGITLVGQQVLDYFNDLNEALPDVD